MQKTGLSPSTLKSLKLLSITAGTVLILLALFVDVVSFSTHPIWSRTVIGTLGAILVTTGFVIGRKENFFARLSMFLFSIFVTFLVIESTATIALYIIERLSPETEVDPHVAEARIRSDVYRPFVLWRAGPFKGENVTFHDSGLRAVPGASSQLSAIQVFVFGGSTIVGWGVPDSATICAHIQKGMALSLDEPVCVTNFGQQAYVNTQELIELQLQLRAGNIPDLVILYDGFNDVWSAFESDTVGMHFNLQEISDLYENRYFAHERTSTPPGLLNFALELNSIQLMRKLTGMDRGETHPLHREAEPSRCMLDGEDFVDPALFAREIMGIYEGDLRILQALSGEFDFEYRVFWQPMILIGNKTLTSEEQVIFDSWNTFLASIFRECGRLALELDSEYAHFFCITDVFDDVDEVVYQDICHLNTRGDSLIANRILSHVPALSSTSP
jgi:hypothetical protein